MAKILIVDDNEGCRDLYKVRFDYDGFETKIAFSAEQALKLFEKENYIPDVILLDLMLPGMQGDEFLKVLRKDPKTKDIIVIILTAFNSSVEEKFKAEIKPDDYILKIDIMPSDLVARVKELLSSRSKA